ncbi:MAG: sulfur carrier protein ThiS [Thermodesulfovibrionales bacterium]
MKLTVNGEIIDDVKAGTISELLHELKVAPGRVAVEVNMAVIRKTEHDTFRLQDGDVIEIVNFVGGGA